MRHGLLVTLILIITISACTSAVGFELDSVYLAEINRGMGLAMCQEFDSASAVFQRSIARDSTDHAAYLFLAGVYHAEMIDREDYRDYKRFSDLIDKAIYWAEKAINRNDRPAWAHLTIGNAHGYVAAYEGKEGSWFQAIKRGVKAKNQYLKALEIDPTLYDAYLGLGTYHYWKSVKTEFINWLPLVPDRKEQGFEELWLAVDSALFSGDMALNSLVWIHLHEREPSKALRILDRLQQKYPQSRVVWWGYAFACYQAGRLEQAADYFGRILESVENQTGQNYFNPIECRYFRAKIFDRQKRYGEALTEIETLLSYPIGDEIKSRQGNRLKEAKELRSNLQQALQDKI